MLWVLSPKASSEHVLALSLLYFFTCFCLLFTCFYQFLGLAADSYQFLSGVQVPARNKSDEIITSFFFFCSYYHGSIIMYTYTRVK